MVALFEHTFNTEAEEGAIAGAGERENAAGERVGVRDARHEVDAAGREEGGGLGEAVG